MNLLLLDAHEISADGRAQLSGRRAEHAREVLRVQANDTLTVGVRDGQVGTAVVLSAEPLVLDVRLSAPPPPRPGIDLLLAMPRPKGLKRIVQTAASLGVDRVMLIRSARVEKSYFDSKVLEADFMQGLVDLGLEQGKDTVAPKFEVRARFKPFVEDELADWAGVATRLLLHPVPAAQTPSLGGRLLLAIGPDGGWVPFELDLLLAHGFTPVSFGPRTLRVEVAVPFAIGALRPTLVLGD